MTSISPKEMKQQIDYISNCISELNSKKIKFKPSTEQKFKARMELETGLGSTRVSKVINNLILLGRLERYNEDGTIAKSKE